MPRPVGALQSYLDWKRFGVPPHAGGTRDWPRDLLDDFRYIHDTLLAAEELLRDTAGTSPDDRLAP